MKKFLLMLCILFICGILSADLCIAKIEQSNALLDIEMYEGYANANLTFKDVFWNIFYERLKTVLVIVLLCFTPIKEKMVILMISLYSFAWGFFMMSSIAGLGMAGIVVGISSVLPHGLFYGGILAVLLLVNYNQRYRQREKIAFHAVTYISIIMLFLTGCIIESIMGTHFIPWVIRLSLI